MLTLMPYLQHRLREETGDIFGEYGFLFLLVALAAVTGVALLGTNLGNAYTTIAGHF